MLHLVQDGNEYHIQLWKKKVEKCDDDVKEDEQHLKKLESEKKRELYEGEVEE